MTMVADTQLSRFNSAITPFDMYLSDGATENVVPVCPISDKIKLLSCVVINGTLNDLYKLIVCCEASPATIVPDNERRVT